VKAAPEGEENFPPAKYSAVVGAVWGESKKDFKTSSQLRVEALVTKRSLNEPLPLLKPQAKGFKQALM